MRGLLLSVIALGALLLSPGPALAAERTFVFKTRPIQLPGYDVARAVISVPSPKIAGYVTKMSVDVVDTAGNPLTRTHVMLHHAVFNNALHPDMTCASYGWPERFYASSEELWKLNLPEGYGYPNKATDRWGLYYMLMSHHRNPITAQIRYRVTYATGVRLKPVRPVWLDVRNCEEDPQFSVPGTGGKGSTFSKASDFRMPAGGRLVFGFGHVHGGGLRLELENATCHRRLFTSLPTWNGVNPRPYLHEPGPGHMSNFRSAAGIPVAAGQKLRLRAVYDNSLAGTRVMGIMLAYLAPGKVAGCRSAPKLARDPQSSPGRPTRLVRPLIRQPEGKEVRVRSTTVQDFRFGNEKVILPVGAKFTWRFLGPLEHDVTLANGPVGFASDYTLPGGGYSFRFRRAGTYNIMCSLHPSRMSMRIRVVPSASLRARPASPQESRSLLGRVPSIFDRFVSNSLR